MALTVRTNTSTSKIGATVGTPPAINSTVRRVSVDLVNIEELNNVDVSGGLDGGYTLVYDATTQQWVAQLVEGITNIDGGTY